MKEFVDNLGAQEQVLVFALLLVIASFLSIRTFQNWAKLKDSRLLIIAICQALTAAIALFMVFHLATNV
jgi:hypothetical protein